VSTKEIVMEVAKKLPPNATLADAIDELEFRQAVEQGFAELDRGEGIPVAEVRQQLRQWITKSSSRRVPAKT
jgi:predicted transcriptional regulator